MVHQVLILHVYQLMLPVVPDDVQKDIINIFNEHNINHLFFKGSVLAYLYDDPSIRTRGDIDVFVEYNDLVDKYPKYYYAKVLKAEVDLDGMVTISQQSLL